MAGAEHGNLGVAEGLTPTAARTAPAPKQRPDRSPNWPVAPLAPVLAALILGTLVDRAAGGPSTVAWGSAAVALGAASLLAFRHPAPSSLLLTAALAAAGGAYHHHRWFDVDPDDLAASLGDLPEPAWVRGHVEEVVGLRTREARAPGQPPRTRTRFTLRIDAVGDGSTFSPRSGRADVSVQGNRSDLAAGQPVQVAGRISRVAGPLNPGEFDRRAFLQAQGIRLAMTVDEPAGVLADPGGRWSGGAGWLGAIRAWSRDRLIDGLDPRAASLATALVLGRRDDIDPEVVDAFARTGTTHLLAVSGLQLQVMAWAIGMGLVVIGVPRRLRYLLVGSAAAGYALLVGCSPSVMRSMVMTVAFCTAMFASRTTGPADALALAGVLTIVANPSAVFDVGCQLSFLAVGALFWLMPAAGAIGEALRVRVFGPPDVLDEVEAWHQAPGRRLLSWAGRHAARLAAASAIVWCVAAPLSALRFHLVSPAGILLNIPLVPLTSLALLAGAFKLTMAALAALLAALAAPSAWLAGPLAWGVALAGAVVVGLERLSGGVVGGSLRLVEVVATRGAAVPWGTWYAPGPPATSVAIFYVLLLVAAYLMHAGPRREGPPPVLRRSRYLAWGAVSAWCVPGWMFAGPGPPADLEAEVLAVSHGLAVVIATPDGETFLYDCGRMDDPGVGRRVVAPALWARGVSRLDAVFLSHADDDHYNGLPDVLDRFDVGEVVVPEGFVGRDNPAAVNLLRIVRARGVPVREMVAPASRPAGSTRMVAVHPPAGWDAASDNARSLVLDVSRQGRSLLLTGDVEQVGLAELLSRPEPDRPVDVLLSPHHGARAANPPRLYDWARPRVVVASQKPPTAGVVDALTPLESRDIVLLRTWQAGAVSLRWSPAGVVASGFLDGPRGEGKGGRMTWLIVAAGFGAGIFAGLALVVVEFGAWALVTPRRPSDPISSGSSESIRARAADGVTLSGRWIPADRPTGRTVVLIHGFIDGPGAMILDRAPAILGRGWNVAAIDLRAYGDSEGLYSTFGAHEAGDLRAWLDVLADLIPAGESFVPVVWGRSMGAAIALRAGVEDARVLALVLEAPMVDLRSSVATVMRKKRLPMAPTLSRLVVRRAGRIAGASLARPGLLDLAPRFDRPAIVVHGSDDDLIPTDIARELADAFPTPAPFLEVAGAKHSDVARVGGPELLGRVMDLVDRSVRPEA